jgi:hypothetical protein
MNKKDFLEIAGFMMIKPTEDHIPLTAAILLLRSPLIFFDNLRGNLVH